MDSDNRTTNGANMAVIHGRVIELFRDLADSLDTICKTQPNAAPESDARSRTRMSDHLAELRRHLRRQFAREEETQWLDDNLTESPQYRDAVMRLSAEHHRLLEKVDHLFHQLQCPHQPAPAWADVGASFRRIIAEYADHELRDEELIQSILTVDVGVGD